MTQIVADLETRGRQNYGTLTELMTSIQKHGLIHLLLCTLKLVSRRTGLVAGGRRYKAVEMLNWEEISVRIYNTEKTELELRPLNCSRISTGWN